MKRRLKQIAKLAELRKWKEIKWIQGNKRLIAFLGTALIVGVFLSIIFLSGFAEIWNLKLSDNLFTEKKAPDNIKIIAIDDKSLQEFGKWPWQRDKIARVLDKVDAKIIGIDVRLFERDNKDYVLEGALNDNIVLAEEIVYPSGYVLKPTVKHNNLGVINVFIDSDGIVREVPTRADGHYGFAYKIAKSYLGNFKYEEDRLRVNYAGGPGKFERISFSDAMRKGVKADIVLIGATAADLHDNYLTPTSHGANMAGVEIHANAVQTFLTGNYLSEQNAFEVVFLILIFCVIGAIVMFCLTMRWSSMIILGLIFLYYFYALFMFDKGLMLNMIYPVAGLMLVYVLSVALYYALESRARKKVENVFGKCVSQNVMKHVMQIPELHGTEKEITVLFADIRGFTKMSEKMRPKEVVSMLNSYLGELANIVMKHDGTLDKYMGDCIMVFFNAPAEQSNHLFRAVICAMEMQEKVNSIRESHKHKVGIGIGINSGEAVVGNMGSKERMEYTVIGDTVNIASRLCSAAGADQILITEETYRKLKDKFKAKKLGKMKMKGKEKSINVYNVTSCA